MLLADGQLQAARQPAVLGSTGLTTCAAAAVSYVPLCAQLPFTTCAYELGFFGINLKKLVLNNNRDFLFSEVGVGGGAQDGR